MIGSIGTAACCACRDIALILFPHQLYILIEQQQKRQNMINIVATPALPTIAVWG